MFYLKMLQDVVALLPDVPEAAETSNSYELVHSALQSFITTVHAEWYGKVDSSLAAALGNSLLQQDKGGGGMLTMNFDKKLLVTSQEVCQRAKFPISCPVYDGYKLKHA